MKRFPRTAGRRGFTLVELLVVIGIIAILIAILLPTLSRARRQGNLVKCSSAMRQIGLAFALYSKDNRGGYPVVKWDWAWGVGGVPKAPDGITARYWPDFFLRYYSKTAPEERVAAGNLKLIDKNKNLFWGCPEWQGQVFFGASEGYQIGYGFNIFPMYTAKTQVGDPNNGYFAYYKARIAMDSVENNIMNGPLSAAGTPQSGKGYHPYKDWTPAAERCLITESWLWLLWVNPTDLPSGAPGRQPADGRGVSELVPGFNNIDRYRHGKYPRVLGDNTFDDKGGRVSYNILYGDGHVITASSIKEGYHAFQLRDP